MKTPLPSHHGHGCVLGSPPRFEITSPVPRQGEQGTGSDAVWSLTAAHGTDYMGDSPLLVDAGPADTPCMKLLAHRVRAQESGFTLVEVLVAMSVLVVGILGVATLLNTANATTASSLAREGSTNLAREVLERARQVPYASLGGTSANTLIRARFTDETTAAGSGTAWTITRRGVTYTVNSTACRVDDPSDGIGPIDSTFCSYVPGGGGTGSAVVGGTIKVSLELAGIPLNIGADGSIVNAVCNALGSNPSVDALLATTSSLIAQGADIQVCSGGLRNIAVDSNADDVTRITTTVTYTRSGNTRTIKQSAMVPNPGTATS